MSIAVDEQYYVFWHRDTIYDTISNWLRNEINQTIDCKILYKILSL
jgi:hypothetical protein